MDFSSTSRRNVSDWSRRWWAVFWMPSDAMWRPNRWTRRWRLSVPLSSPLLSSPLLPIYHIIIVCKVLAYPLSIWSYCIRGILYFHEISIVIFPYMHRVDFSLPYSHLYIHNIDHAWLNRFRGYWLLLITAVSSMIPYPTSSLHYNFLACTLLSLPSHWAYYTVRSKLCSLSLLSPSIFVLPNYLSEGLLCYSCSR